MATSGEFVGQVVVVTGAAGGIGRATVLAFAAAGASVVAVDLDEARAHATADLVTADGGAALGFGADVSDEAGVAHYVQAALDAYGQIDVLVNCAGVEMLSPIVDTTLEAWDRQMNVNVRSVFLGLRAVLPLMYARRSGAVVNTSSVNGYVANPWTCAYTASKHAVIGITKVAAMEAGPFGVRVNAVCPGATNTDMLHRFADAPTREKIAGDVPLGRLGEPADIAAAICFLASPRAAYVNGEELKVDGGLLAGRTV